MKRDNSFDLIRHAAALLVLYTHHFALSGLEEPTIPRWDTFGFLAVSIFFAISGYLMPISFNNSNGFMDFMEKRCRRIFPGFIVCSFIMVFVIGAIFTTENIVRYLLDIEQVKTFVMFSAFAGRPIPTVFSDFIFPNAINGSIWTLPVEFLCYIIIGACFSLYFSWKTAFALVVVSSVSKMWLTLAGYDFSFYFVPMSYLTMFGVAFSFGALMSMTKDSWEKYKISIVIFSLIVIMLMRGRPEIQVLGLMAISAITIVLGLSVKDKFINGRFDISYGIYIYAFPIQQIVINRVTDDFWVSMMLSAFLTILAGILSYRYVEAPFLTRFGASKLKASFTYK